MPVTATTPGLRSLITALGLRYVAGIGPDHLGVAARSALPPKMNDIDPQAWLADVLARIAERPAQKLDELLPWNWRPRSTPQSQAA